MSYFFVVTGPPCSGKSTYVNKMKGPSDLVFDLDLLRQALGSKVTHGKDPAFLRYAFAARRALLREIGSMTAPTVWYISCTLTPEERALLPQRLSLVQIPYDADGRQ